MTGRPIRQAASRAELNAVLGAMAREGRMPACFVARGEPPHTSDDPKTRQAAVALCDGCPARDPCRAVGRAERHQFGVWGGRDFTKGHEGGLF